MSIASKMVHRPPVYDGDEQICTVFDGQDRAPCKYFAKPGTTRCEMHGGNFEELRAQKKEIRTYKLEVWRSQLDRFHESDTIKSLREEVAIARMTLEGILAKCRNSNDLLIFSSKIALMLKSIQDLVVNCNKLEDRLGLVLDKSAIIALTDRIVEVIGVHVPEDTLSLISDQIAEAVMQSGKVPLNAPKSLE